ncbi:uncharacterized protein LOC141632666 [Silene latifolia]|uniref:uncharacterized protein LOC141632666 n=1 Tax=Silene latifolia TaxID=37657 RepID=UPI003D77ED68
MEMKEEEMKKPKVGRPISVSECCDPALADKWRQQVLREIGRKVAFIQNEDLGEHRLRDLNDEINNLILEKSNWERRILELAELRLRDLNDEINKLTLEKSHSEKRILELGALNPNRGYRYFGAAKKLLEGPADAVGEAAMSDLEFVEEITREMMKAFKSDEVPAVGIN